MQTLPVVLVHGIWDSSTRLAPLREGLVARGIANVHAIDAGSLLGVRASAPAPSYRPCPGALP